MKHLVIAVLLAAAFAPAAGIAQGMRECRRQCDLTRQLCIRYSTTDRQRADCRSAFRQCMRTCH